MMNAERALDAPGDRTRRRIFMRLRHRARCAGELARGMRVTRSAVSQHLQVLRAAGLVAASVEGTRHLNQVDARDIATFRRWLDGFWDETLPAFQAKPPNGLRTRRGRARRGIEQTMTRLRPQ